MNTLVINQVEAQGISESYPVFAEIARRLQAIRVALSKITAPVIYRQELKVGRRMAAIISRHAKLTDAFLWIMGIMFAFEIIMKG